MDDSAQGAVEYTLLVAGVLLIVIAVVVMLRNTVLPSARDQLNDSLGSYRNVVSLNCTGPKGACYNLG
ncbi:MAG: hypothetical protein AABW54_02890 [Candidatus Micrarchaeota archaeon]